MFEQIKTIEIWQYPLAGNTVGDFAIALGAFLGFLVIFKIFQVVILAHLKSLAKKTKTDIDDTFVDIIKSLKPPFYSFLAFYAATFFVTVSDTFKKLLDVVLIAWIILQVIIATQILIDYVVRKKMGEEEDVAAENAINILGKLSKWVLWSIGLLLILSNLGINVTSLIAGLGIGGIAIALALQNTLSELFSSFSIYFDKPFTPGDFIVIGDKKGVVEKIGIKTTRLKALQGEELIISNKELTSAQIQNFKKMTERRISFSFGVTYETSIEKVKKIPGVVKEIIDGEDGARFDRAHFSRFDDSALNFDVVYYVQSGDYANYMDIQQSINLKIMEKFENMGVAMAYPTRTIYMAK
jgi:small-conductance mechanosensitive channel